MFFFKDHYLRVVQHDLVLSENPVTTLSLPALNRIELSLKKKEFDETCGLSCLSALFLLCNQRPYLISEPLKSKKKDSREIVKTKIILRGSKMYNFWFFLLAEIFPRLKEFDGFNQPKHFDTFSFSFKDPFIFPELLQFYSYFEGLSELECKLSFSTKSKNEVLMVGRGLQICFSFEY